MFLGLGVQVKLSANYFALKVKADYELYQYRVDFSDPEERVFVKNAWLHQHQATLGEKWLFDGTQLFSTVPFARPDKVFSFFLQNCIVVLIAFLAVACNQL